MDMGSEAVERRERDGVRRAAAAAAKSKFAGDSDKRWILRFLYQRIYLICFCIKRALSTVFFVFPVEVTLMTSLTGSLQKRPVELAIMGLR